MASLISKIYKHPLLVTGVATATAAATAYVASASLVTAALIAAVTAVAFKALHLAKDWRTFQLSITGCTAALITHIVEGPAKLELGAVALAIVSLAVGVFVWRFGSNKALPQDNLQPMTSTDHCANVERDSKASGKSEAFSARAEESAGVAVTPSKAFSKVNSQPTSKFKKVGEMLVLEQGNLTIPKTTNTAYFGYGPFENVSVDYLKIKIQDVQQLEIQLTSKLNELDLAAQNLNVGKNSKEPSDQERFHIALQIPSAISEVNVLIIWNKVCGFVLGKKSKIQAVHFCFQDKSQASEALQAVLENLSLSSSPENSGSGQSSNSGSGEPSQQAAAISTSSSSQSSSFGTSSSAPSEESPFAWMDRDARAVSFGGFEGSASSASSSTSAVSSASSSVPLPQQPVKISIEPKNYKLTDDTFVVAYFTDEPQRQAFEKERGQNGKALMTSSPILGWKWDTSDTHPEEQRNQRVDRILRGLELPWNEANSKRSKIAFKIPKNTSFFIASKILEAFKRWLKEPDCKFTSVILLHEGEEAQFVSFREGLQKLSLL